MTEHQKAWWRRFQYRAGKPMWQQPFVTSRYEWDMIERFAKLGTFYPTREEVRQQKPRRESKRLPERVRRIDEKRENSLE